MEVVGQRTNDGSVELLFEAYGVSIQERHTLVSHSVRIHRAQIHDTSLQRGYINDFWAENIIKDKFQPIRWTLEEFYIDSQTRLRYNSDFISWTFSCDEKGKAEKFFIESIHHPSKNIIEGYNVCIETEETYLYEYRLYDIDMMIFSL